MVDVLREFGDEFLPCFIKTLQAGLLNSNKDDHHYELAITYPLVKFVLGQAIDLPHQSLDAIAMYRLFEFSLWNRKGDLRGNWLVNRRFHPNDPKGKERGPLAFFKEGFDQGSATKPFIFSESVTHKQKTPVRTGANVRCLSAITCSLV
ncbi:MAG: hypothetical protein LPK80_06590 [Bacteroidota bacterium]|nr:hypothetical protein [Bacteroidota bacterium]